MVQDLLLLRHCEQIQHGAPSSPIRALGGAATTVPIIALTANVMVEDRESA